MSYNLNQQTWHSSGASDYRQLTPLAPALTTELCSSLNILLPKPQNLDLIQSIFIADQNFQLLGEAHELGFASGFLISAAFPGFEEFCPKYICFIAWNNSSVIPNIYDFWFATGTSFMPQKSLFIDNLAIPDRPINKDIY